MSYKPHYDKGDWLCICDACGRLYPASKLQQRWDGFMVCPDDYETRHPQDFVRGVADIQAPKWTRPEASDTFVHFLTASAVAGIAVAGVAVSGNPGWGSVPPGTFNGY